MVRLTERRSNMWPDRFDSSPSNGSQHSIILTFHKVQPQFSFGATNFSPKRMEQLCRWLASRQYFFVSLDELHVNRDNKAVTVTFDDGYAHLMDILQLLVETYGLKPTVFIPTEYIGKPNSWDYSSVFRKTYHLDAYQIRELSRLGIQFGSHGHSHTDLTRCDHERLTRELKQSKSILEDILGSKVDCISYPFGNTNRDICRRATEAGYTIGVTMTFPRPDDPFISLGRLPVYGYDTLFSIGQKIEHGPMYPVERMKSRITNYLSGGNSWYRRLTRR